MNLVTNEPKRLTVTLSRRNLLMLLDLLDRAVGMPSLSRTVDSLGTRLTVRAEEDGEHYSSPARQAEVRG